MSTLILVAALLYGACIGSFLNVCIFRLPRRCLRLWRPKLSFCPKCRRTLPWYDNLPIVAFLFLLGRCRVCKARIPTRYFLVEVATAGLFLYLAHRFLVTPGEIGLPRHWAEAVVLAVLGCALLVCSAVDADHRIIPDEIDVPGFLLAPVVAFFVPHILAGRALDLVDGATTLRTALESALPWWGLPAGAVQGLSWPLVQVESLAQSAWEPSFRAAFASVLGAAAGGGLIYGIGWAGDRLFKSDALPDGAMGFGDVKFMAMIGAVTGWQGVVGSVAIASISGSIWGIGAKFASGRAVVTGKELALATPLSYLALRVFGAPSEAADDDQPVRLWPGGWLAARFATGDPYIPFGPFLALGAFLIALWPSEVWQFFVWMGSHLRIH